MSNPIRYTESAMAMADAAIESARRASGLPPALQTQPQPQQQEPTPGTAEFVRNPAATTQATPPAPAAASDAMRQLGANHNGELDLENNDNAFHIVATLVSERIVSKVIPGETSYTLSEEDTRYFDQTLPQPVRVAFVKSLRARIPECPPEGTAREAPIHILTRKCQKLGLDRDDSINPLLADSSQYGGCITVTNLPADLGLVAARSRSNTPTPGYRSPSPGPVHDAPLSPSYQAPPSPSYQHAQQQFSTAPPPNAYPAPAPAPPPQSVLRTSSFGQPSTPGRGQGLASQITAPFRRVSSTPPARPEPPQGLSGQYQPPSITTGMSDSVARQQLMSELKEATQLMSESVTPEAAEFWKNHVKELQARLRALNGEPDPTVIGGGTSPSPDKLRGIDSPLFQTREEYLKNNRDMVRTSSNVSAAISARASPTRSVTARGQVPEDSSNIPMVDVVAPNDLPAGYQFEAQLGEKRFLATVPTGGVKKGEQFTCLMLELQTLQMEVPVGHWRDGLFDCGVQGFCHALFLNTLFCPLIALGQIMTRSGLTWIGKPSQELVERRSPFMNMMIIVFFWVAMNLMSLFVIYMKTKKGIEATNSDYIAVSFINLVMFLFSVSAVSNTRSSIRAKYYIPEATCYDVEDLVCATFCMPCTICQMGRHTADYDTYVGICCSRTGMPGHVELPPSPTPRNSSESRAKDGYIT